MVTCRLRGKGVVVHGVRRQPRLHVRVGDFREHLRARTRMVLSMYMLCVCLSVCVFVCV
jgi:hypothetical protein